MRKLKHSLSILLMLALFMNQIIYAEETDTGATAEGQEALTATAVEDVPSLWATWEVQMANVYGLGDTGTYAHYKAEASVEQLLALEASFEKAFSFVDETKLEEDARITRGAVAKEFYDVIDRALDIDGEPTLDIAIKYLEDNKIIRGKGNNELALDDFCTTQELILIAKRVYDNLVYALDEDAKGCFWKVSDEDNTVYLLGSIHVSDGSIYPMSKNIMTGYVNSDYLVVEANVLVNKPEDTAYVQQLMMLEGDQTLDQLISEESYERYVELVSSLGVKEEIYNKVKPWYAAILAQTILMSQSNLQGGLGVDVYFLSASTGYKPIIELESVREQMDMFDSFSNELQEGYLNSVLADSDNQTADTVNQMLSYWKAGDIDNLEKILLEEDLADPLAKEFNEKLLTTRNANMLTKVEAMLKDDTSHDYFVVVGAAHMLADDGIVQGLRDAGYTVEQE